MAAVPTLLSFMQPTITFIFNSLAFVIILRAGVIPLHLVSFILIPLKCRWHFSTSCSTTQLSSAMSGSGDFSYKTFMPSQLSFASGCSTNSTPSSFKTGIFSSACSSVHPALASTLKMALVCFRKASTILISPSTPTFIL